MSVLVFITLFLISISIVGWWMLFKKMGFKGYQGIIPFYNSYLLFDKIWNKKYFVPYLLSMLIMCSFPGSSKKAVLIVIFIFACLIYVFLDLALSVKLADTFKRGVLFGILMFLIKPVMFLILGANYDRFHDPKVKIKNHQSLSKELESRNNGREKK